MKKLFALFAAALSVPLFSCQNACERAAQDAPLRVDCPGIYPHHLQGIAVKDGKFFWSQTSKLVKTDFRGGIEKQADVVFHHGDICVAGEKLYAAVNMGKFNKLGKSDDWVFVYDLDLNLVGKHKIGEMKCGLGGIEFYGGSFYLVGGDDESTGSSFRVGKYSPDFKLEKMFFIPRGNSWLGAQTICRANGKFWLGVYTKEGCNERLWEADDNFNIVKKREINGAFGIAPLGGRAFLIGHSRSENNENKRYTAWAEAVEIE